MSASSIPPIADPIDAYLQSLATTTKNTNLSEAVVKYRDAKKLHIEIMNIWKGVQGNISPQAMSKLKPLNDQLSFCANELLAALNSAVPHIKEILKKEIASGEQKSVLIQKIFGNCHKSTTTNITSIGHEWSDYAMASQQTLELAENETRLAAAKKQHLANKPIPTLQEEVEALNKLSNLDPAKKYWYDNLISKQFKKRKVIGDGSCALRVVGGFPEVEEQRNSQNVKKRLDRARFKMLEHIRDNWNRYKNTFRDSKGKPYPDFSSYAMIMIEPSAYLGREELQVLSNIQKSTYKIYHYQHARTNGAKLLPSEEINPQDGVASEGEIHFYYNPAPKREHYDLLLPRGPAAN